MATSNTALQQQTITPKVTNWSQTLDFQQFDPSLGTLTGAAFGLVGDISGSILLDNLDLAPASFGVGFSGSLYLLGPDGSTLMGVAPSAGATTTLAAGATTTLTGISGSASEQENYAPSTAPSGIAEAPFVGTGTVPLTVDTALSTFQVTGPGNMALVAQEAAGASVSLQYGYTPANSGGGSGSSAGSDVTLEYHQSANFTTVLLPQLPTVTTTPQTFSFANRTTGWNDSAAISQFDPALGTLQSVNITVSADLVGSIAAENLGSSAASVSTTDAVTLTLDLPGSTPTFAYGPSISDSMSLGAFDGSVDYAGTSGRIDQLSVQPVSSSTTLNIAADLAPFTGQGVVVLPVSATSSATIDGPGNLAAGLLTDAGGTVSVSYTYLPATTDTTAAEPAPSGTPDYSIFDATTNQADTTTAPIGASGHQLFDASGDNLAVSVTSDNWIIGTGGGNDVIVAHGGDNVLYAGGGSNFLFGAGGNDTFVVQAGDSNAWSTVVNFHPGDWLTVWGVSAQEAVSWMSGQGATGYTGLTMDAAGADGTATLVTLARSYSTADLSNGRLTTGFGTDPASGGNYLYVHANS